MVRTDVPLAPFSNQASSSDDDGDDVMSGDGINIGRRPEMEGEYFFIPGYCRYALDLSNGPGWTAHWLFKLENQRVGVM